MTQSLNGTILQSPNLPMAQSLNDSIRKLGFCYHCSHARDISESDGIGWRTGCVTLNEVKGLSERFFALAQNDTSVTSFLKVYERRAFWISYE
jgi:hypothetical protein